MMLNTDGVIKAGANRRRIYVLFFVLFYAAFSFLSLNRHSKADTYNYHSEVWADKAGYYVYLPSLLIYDFDAKKLPHEIGAKTGNGFNVDSRRNKITTKYTYGVALMQAPFFLAAHILAKSLGYPADGFSLPYNKMIDFAAVFYAALAFLFLYFFLIRYVSKKIAILSLVILFLGTNLFYYSIFDTGMSHVYSFFLFSAFLYMAGRMFRPGNSILLNIVFGLVVGLIIMVRPINVIFLPVFFMFNQPDWGNIKSLIKPLLIIACTVFVLIIPQLIYWKYLSGHLFMYSYPNEGFTNFFPPKIGSIWFSTNNGLFIYSPLVLLILCGLVFMKKRYPRWSIFLAIYFLFISYLFSSWWTWSYGCGFGSRPFVEFYALFSLPLCFLIQSIGNNKWQLYLLGALLIACVAWNLKLTFSYDGCWYGGNWDWPAFGQLIVGPTK